MLTSANIHRFRTCIETVLEDPPLVLIGHNGAGKTNLLHALTWCARGGVDDSSAISELEGHVTLYLTINSRDYTYSVRRFFEGSEYRVFENLMRIGQNGMENAVIVRENENLMVGGMDAMSIPMNVSGVRAVQSFYAGSPSLKNELQAISTFLDGVIYYPLMPTQSSEDGGFFWLRDFEAWKKSGKKTISSDIELDYLLFDAWWNNREKFEELQALLGPSTLGIIDSVYVYQYTPGDPPSSGYATVDGTARDKADKSLFAVFFIPRGSQQWMKFRQLSMGTKRVIQMIAHLIMDRISLALIEQPEDALHPAMVRKLMAIINTYSIGFQSIVTSHSPDLFNCVSPNQIRMVSYEGQRTHVARLTPHQIEVAQEYMDSDGSLSEFLDLL